MISFPFVSKNADRAIGVNEFALLLKSYFTNGVFMKESTSLQVVATTGMNVIVTKGAGSVEGHWCYEDNNRTLAVQSASTLDRIDNVVLRLDTNSSVRSCDLYIVAGTPANSPVAPTPTRTSTVYELVLARVLISKGSTSISTSKITDTRLNSSLCGVVTGTVSQLDTTSVFNQYQGTMNTLISDLNTAIETAKLSQVLDGAVTKDKLAKALYDDLAKIKSIEDLTKKIDTLNSNIEKLNKDNDKKKVIIKQGSRVYTAKNDTSVAIFNHDELKKLLGVSTFLPNKCACMVSNGDGGAQVCHVEGSTFWNETLFAVFDRKVVGYIRINYTIVYNEGA